MAEAIFQKWELDFAVIGEVTDTGRMVLEWKGETVCDIPLAPLADDAPLYDRPHVPTPKARAARPLFPPKADMGADL
jgi:phosphoribosylformylglycinamidine (FGAM) synthase-like enzyme